MRSIVGATNSGISSPPRRQHLCESRYTAHALYERAGTLALEGGLNHYNVIIDEVPNAVTVARQVSFKSFQKHYLEPGYCEVAPSGLVSPTEKGLSEADSLKEVMDDLPP